MHFTLHKARGRVLFSNDEFSLLKIKSSAVDSIGLTVETLKLFPCHEGHTGLDSQLGPRFPSILFLSKVPYRYKLGYEEIAALDEEAVNSGDLDLQNVLMTIKFLKGKQKEFCVSETFLTADFDGKNISNCVHSAILENGKVECDIDGSEFTLNVTGNTDAKGVYFVNEFESIHIPLDESQFSEILGKLIERSKLNGRITGEYLVIPSSRVYRNKINMKKLPNMKTEDMLTFFGHHGKSGSKVETLSGCLENLTRRNVQNIGPEVGKTGILHLSTYSVSESPFDIPPTDWALSRLSHMKIKKAEAVNAHTTNIFVEMVDKPVDDMAQALYTTFEQSKKPINLAFFNEQVVHNVFAAMRRRADEGVV